MNPAPPPPHAPPPPPTGPVGGYGLALPPGVSAESAYQKPGGAGSEPLGLVGLILGVLSLPLYLCCGGLSIVLNLVGLGLGVAALARGRSAERQGSRAVAMAAVIVNGLLLLLSVVAMLFFFGMMGFGILSGP